MQKEIFKLIILLLIIAFTSECYLHMKDKDYENQRDAMGRNYPSYFDRNNCNHYYTLCAKLHNEFKRQQKQSKLDAKDRTNINVKR